MNRSIGAIEFRSIGSGIKITDTVLKKASVELIYFKSICPGRLLTIVCGNEGEVQEAIEAGLEEGEGTIIDSFVLNAVHTQIIDALKNKCKKYESNAVGIVETSSVCSGIKALDKVLKEANVDVIKLKLAFGVGGKLIFVVSGEVSDIENGFSILNSCINTKKIINISVIPSPDLQLISMLT